MSDNSGNGAFGRPTLNGYTVEWSVATGEWVATSDTYGTELRGKDQAELDAARWTLVNRLADELQQQLLKTAPLFGYSPPPA
jgi:hypothetical protein